MKFPEGFTEPEIIAKVQHVAHTLAGKFFSFIPGYTAEDIQSFVWLHALELLAKLADPARPNIKFDPAEGTLDALLYKHAVCRILNLHRNLVFRVQTPCRKCNRAMQNGTQDFCEKSNGEEACRSWRNWLSRNVAKAQLSKPLNIDNNHISGECGLTKEGSPEFDLETREILELLTDALSPELQAVLQKSRDGVKLTRDETKQLRAAVADFFDDAGLELPS